MRPVPPAETCLVAKQSKVLVVMIEYRDKVLGCPQLEKVAALGSHSSKYAWSRRDWAIFNNWLNIKSSCSNPLPSFFWYWSSISDVNLFMAICVGVLLWFIQLFPALMLLLLYSFYIIERNCVSSETFFCCVNNLRSLTPPPLLTLTAPPNSSFRPFQHFPPPLFFFVETGHQAFQIRIYCWQDCQWQ